LLEIKEEDMSIPTDTESEFRQISGDFSDWLAKVICGLKEIDFYATETAFFRTLVDAKSAYSWPPKKTVVPIPGGPDIVLAGNSNLSANQLVLNQLASGLTEALKLNPRDDVTVSAWVKAIFVWGGVFKKGNRTWLATMHGRLGMYLDSVLTTLNTTASENASVLNSLPVLRSNAGTTKIHALALRDFIMYDSRVAASLSWLVLKWACEEGRTLPLQLRFGCMRANQNGDRKRRTPDEHLFPYFAPVAGNAQSNRKHAIWNIRANSLIRAALDKSYEVCGEFSRTEFPSLREVEAALFSMGKDLSFALGSLQPCISKMTEKSTSDMPVKSNHYRIQDLVLLCPADISCPSSPAPC
jgi:hypothetical protein